MFGKRWILWGVLTAAPLSQIWASATQAGAVFLTIFPGAKATGMAAAFSAVADDATASYYNPGSLAFFKETQFSLIHAPWLPALANDMYYEFAGFVHPMGQGVLGGHIIYLNLGTVEAYDDNGNYIGSWKPADYAFCLSYGFQATPQVGVGFTGKLIRSFLAPRDILARVLGEPSGGTATTFALGGGVFYKTGIRGLTLAAVLDNLGPGLKYTGSGRREDLPYLLRLGVAYRPIWNDLAKVTLAFDVNKVLVGLNHDLRNNGMAYVVNEAFKHFGLDFTLVDILSMRLGYFYDKEGARKGLTLGFGVRFKSFQLDIADDSRIYAFDESSNRRFALTYIMNQ